MKSQVQVEAQIAAYLAEGPTTFPLEWRDQIASSAGQIAQRRAPAAWRAAFENRWFRVAFAVLAIGLLAALVAQFTKLPDVGPQLTVTPWTHDSMREAFPVPLREEPRDGPGVVDSNNWADPLNDGRPTTDPRVDLVTIEFSQPSDSSCLRPNQLCLFFAPAQPLERPIPEPDNDWISYGLVLDTDVDGVADSRFGLDNIPGGFFRAWYPDPETSETTVYLGSSGHSADGAYGESEFPIAGEGTRLDHGYMWISSALAGTSNDPRGQFYVWAALVRDGQIVSLDYAPDVGWLKAAYVAPDQLRTFFPNP